MLFTAVEAACCVAKAALMPDENTFLVSPLAEAEARIRTWGDDGVSGTKGEALTLLRNPCSLEVAARGSSRPGPRSWFLIADSHRDCLRRKWEICSFTRTTPALCKHDTTAPEAKECWCYQVLHTWIWGTPPYKSAWGLSRGVAWGKEHPLTCCLRYITCTCDEMWGLLPSSPLSGDKCSDCDTKTRSVICTFRNVISLQVKCWESYGDSLAGRQSLTRGSPQCRHGHFLAWPWQGLLWGVEL